VFERQLSSKRVYGGRIIDVRVDQVQLEDGAETTREVVEHAGSTAIIALDELGQVLLVEQYRYAVGAAMWEIPAGRLEVGESPAQAATRELAEEAGLRADHLEHILTIYVSPGYCTERLSIFLATGLGPAQAEPDPDERIAKAWFPLSEAVTMCLYGQVTDAKTIAAVLAVAARRREPAQALDNAR
jgi:ADP-ribose pyrophosphatase